MRKIKSVTIEFDFDRILATVVIGEKNVKTIADRLLNEKTLREWYKEQFPIDTLRECIANRTWYSLLLAMREGTDAQSIIGVVDSVVRERIFGHLAKLLNVPYDVIYYLWLRENINY